MRFLRTRSGSFTNQQSSMQSWTSMSKERWTRLPKRPCRECAFHGLILELSILKMHYRVAKLLLFLMLSGHKLHSNFRKAIWMLASQTSNPSWRCVSTFYRTKSKSKSKSMLNCKINYSRSWEKTNRALENRKITMRII